MPKIWQKGKSSVVVFHEEFVTLKEIRDAHTANFPSVDKSCIWLKPIDPSSGENVNMILKGYPRSLFLDHGNSLGCRIHPYISLAQIESQIAVLECDPKKVKIFWFNGELCISVEKDPSENYHGGEDCHCCHKRLCKCSDPLTTCLGCNRCAVCCRCPGGPDRQA